MSNSVVLEFGCGCRMTYFVHEDGRLGGALSCCVQHEALYRQLADILPLMLIKASFHLADRLQDEVQPDAR